MERLKHVKETLLSAVESQIGDLAHVDAKELGEVVDMVKDMEEAMYYCSITKAMKEREEEEKYSKHSQPQYIPMYMPQQERYPSHRDMDRDRGRMYYGERGMEYREGMYGRDEMERYRDRNSDYESSERKDRYPAGIRDVREGKSPMSRKNYMESKELHKGTPVQLKELEKYLQELSQDITEMISDASPEEKTVLQQKLSMLAAKIK